jgi:uncharacterized membrane protein HdeD (DUF308 family)
VTVGGLFIFLNPLADVVAPATLIAAVILAQGCVQVTFAINVRPQLGWGLLLASGIFALLASAALFTRFPFLEIGEPNTVVGIFLIFAGCCHSAFAALGKMAHRRVALPRLGTELGGGS